ncbi:MAG: aminotransferase class V-fold PLP-dependent enzyme [Bacteroidetes bacterium]|nr:MAG: aminotransferase class V-fold PLP-dependent enzyme [Bacteroidota bacterium]
MDRRRFMKQSVPLGIAAFYTPQSLTATSLIPDLNALPLESVDLSDPSDEEAWAKISAHFMKPEGVTQLEHGYFSHSPTGVLLETQRAMSDIQRKTSLFMRREQDQWVEDTRTDLAKFLNVPATELAITRNTTESLNTVIQGFHWKAGDEVIIGDQDYGSMNEAFEQASKRYGIVLKVAKVPLIPKSDEEVVDAYMSLLTAKTKMLHLTHLINLSGQVIPLEKLCKAARDKAGDELCIVVDAAHSLNHVPVFWREAGCDIMAASLHKWTMSPLGLGMLWVKEAWIPRIWPLMGDVNRKDTDIRRLEHLGTRPLEVFAGLRYALKFHREVLPIQAKAARLRYLQESWTASLKDTKHFQSNTPLEAGRSYAIANLKHSSLKPAELAQKLWDEFKIFTVAIDHPVVKGVRITPHLSNSIEDIHRLNTALKVLDK